MRGAVPAVCLALASVLTAGPALAQDPPRWAYLAECSAVFRSVSLSRGYAKVTDEQIEMANAAADRFRARSVEAAGEAGQKDPEADVASIMVYLEPRWENRIENILSLKSNLDWIAYCRQLGREEGVLTPDLAP
jgi:hypothetical protein